MAKLQPIYEAFAHLNQIVDTDDYVVDVQLKSLKEAVLVQVLDKLKQRVFLDRRAVYHQWLLLKIEGEMD